MSKHVTYTCDMCSRDVKESQAHGFIVDTESVSFRPPGRVSRHICNACLRACSKEANTTIHATFSPPVEA